jgi:hypothetical protein
MRMSKGAQERQNKGRWMTDEMMAAHDRELILRKSETIRARVVEKAKAEVDKHIDMEWKAREEIFRPDGDSAEGFFNIMQLLLAVPARILIEKFHWKPIPKDGVYDKRNKLMMFSDYMVDELNMIMDDEMQDIRRYCDETYEKYGVKFMREEDDSAIRNEP